MEMNYNTYDDDSFFCDSWIATEKKKLSTIKEMDSIQERPSLHTCDYTDLRVDLQKQFKFKQETPLYRKKSLEYSKIN